MLVKVQGVLLDVVEKEYNFEGKQGISTKLMIYSNGRVQPVKISRENIQFYRSKLNEEIEVDCTIFVNGKYSLTIR